jgi:HAE1 family hydrophobic/amphiphilic exporter-1
MPEIQFPFLAVSLPYQGSTPSEVERIVTRPVEEALSTLTGMQRMNSVTRADGVNIEMQFKWGQDTRGQGGRGARKDRCDPRRSAADLTRYQIFKGSTADQPVC